jgi:hypothetical protein
MVEGALRVGTIIVGLGEVGYFWPKQDGACAQARRSDCRRARGGRCMHLLRHHLERIGRICTWLAEIALDHHLEIREDRVVDGYFPIEITTHLPECKHALYNDAPRFVRIRIVANDLCFNHEGRNK